MKHPLAIKLIFAIALLALPYVAAAGHAPVKSNVFDPTILNGPLVVCTGTGSSGTASLPACSNLCDFVAEMANVIYFVIAFILWIIAPILILVGGIMIILAGASPEMVGRGKKTITGAVWGVVIVLCAWVLVSTVVQFFHLTGLIGGFGTAACTL
ncbi:MAG TPA: hypothetical protein VMT81_01050 [Candidatus Paceibacterota bacterium]|nr:hypothetical protein [Candidatus Paceibacterota bacterium]